MALLDAGIMRLRPVLITVGATVIALFPLALHGGPLWEPLCYAQIGGLTVATFVTLLLVPVLYAIFVLDLRRVRWEPMHATPPPAGPAEEEPDEDDHLHPGPPGLQHSIERKPPRGTELECTRPSAHPYPAGVVAGVPPSAPELG